MRQLYPDLWQTSVEMRFGTLRTHAYFLEHSDGNALIYHSAQEADLSRISKMGGVAHQYLSHNHEIVPGLHATSSRLGGQLCGHERMQPYFGARKGLDIAFQTLDTEQHAGGLEVIFTPGHTDNNACYRYASPHGKTYLFTGDTIYLDQGEWRTLVMTGDGGDRSTLHETLLRLGEMPADVLITSAAVGDMRIVEVTRSEWRAIARKLADELT
jgi:glyoxylase-like metal-dependent hydrolase (beta-lactamase superfamily II)